MRFWHFKHGTFLLSFPLPLSVCCSSFVHLRFCRSANTSLAKYSLCLGMVVWSSNLICTQRVWSLFSSFCHHTPTINWPPQPPQQYTFTCTVCFDLRLRHFFFTLRGWRPLRRLVKGVFFIFLVFGNFRSEYQWTFHAHCHVDLHLFFCVHFPPMCVCVGDFASFATSSVTFTAPSHTHTQT